jgi:hypothetical protein
MAQDCDSLPSHGHITLRRIYFLGYEFDGQTPPIARGTNKRLLLGMEVLCVLRLAIHHMA